MATDAASIGANFSDYQGNAALGGAGMPAFQIDTRSLEMLAQYSYYYNREKFQQKQRDLEAAAKEYASLTDYDLTNSIPKFSKEIQQKYNDLYKFAQDNPDVLDYKNNQKGFLEFKKKQQDFETDLLNAKSQDAIYKSAQAVIEKETRPKVKAFLQKQLEDQVAKVDLATPIRLQQYDAKPTVLPEVNKRVFDIQVKDPQSDILYDRKITIADRKFINNTAAAMALGLMDEQLDVNSESFKKLPLDEQTFKIEENKNREATGRLSVIEEAEVLTEALKNPAFIDPTTKKIDLAKVMASNKIIAGSMQAILDHNKVVEEEAKMIEAGAYKGNIKVLQFGINGLDKTDYQPIDYTDGEITATDLLKVKLTAKSPATSYETTSKELNNPLQALQLAETIRNNKANQYLRSKELELSQDRWKATQTGGTTQINGAMERAKRIYADMLKLADKNGLITPDKIRQLNVEQLKYLGIEAPEQRDATGKIVSAGGFKPLSFKGTKGTKVVDIPHAIQLVDGEVRVLVNAQPLNDKDNRYTGQYDPTKSTNLFNIGTNILNEELKNSGSKELNSYLGIDVLGGITSNTDSGTSTVSGQTQNKVVDINTLDPNGFKKEGKNYRYKDGTLFDASGKIVKEK